ncbi:MAG TPA: NADH:flavin oxidoreductase [Hyphomicrobiaceae bacterium]|nr:NADH:flavin oxidoreductase [Hyphomicrobiaceae bacterium]
MLFEPLTINGITFKNRIVRSSLGGRSSYYDGTPSPAWVGFERRFAKTGVASIISATIGINARRMSPHEYPSIAHDRFIPAFRTGVRAVQAEGCRYIMQIGDPGGHTQVGLFSEEADSKSSSAGFDFVYGYRNRLTPMTISEIEASVREFASAARRVREIGCDGLEITASKGYLIHQFLNPGINRRKDEYGGSDENRFRFLREIVVAVRREIGRDFLFGVRLAAEDLNSSPVNLRLPIAWPLRHHFRGNGLAETTRHARSLEALGVDYLHIDAGYGFPHPHVNLGKWPLEGFRLYANSVRHLSLKSRARAVALNLLPGPLARLAFGAGWNKKPGANARYAEVFKKTVKLPVIANGGFQSRRLIEETLTSGKADLVAVGRPLLANPGLIDAFRDGRDEPDRPCTFCGECCAKTATLPLGCYDRSRFASDRDMEAEIMRWSASPPADDEGHLAVELPSAAK